MWFKKKIKDDEIIHKVYQKDRLKRYAEFLIGILIVAIAYNLFLLQNNIVYGVGGLGVMLYKLFGIDPSLVILVGSIFLLFISFIFLGKEKTAKSVVGSLLYPVFVKLTSFVPQYVNLDGMEMILLIVLGAICTGFGLGLIFRAGFTTGGTDILNQIVSKYGKTSMGCAMLWTDGLIIVCSAFVFGIPGMIYSLISLFLISMMSDKVILGISGSKAFYIITEHETDVKRFILKHLSHGITVFNVRGGYTGNNQKMIMCIIPTKEYFLAKEAIKQIDPRAFFVVTDAYEVSGGE